MDTLVFEGFTNKAGAVHCTQPQWAVALAALTLCWPLWAVADCVDGSRNPSPGELDFYNRAMSALIATLPPPPVGVALGSGGSDISRLPGLGFLCAGKDGHKTGAFEIKAERFYVLRDQKAAVRISMNVVRLPTTASVPFAAYGTASPGQSAALRVNNVVWSIGGTESPLRQALVEALDRAYLQGLVGKPLPSVAESHARATQASLVTAAAPAGAAVAPPAVPSQVAPVAAAPASQPAPAMPAEPPAKVSAPDPVRDAVDTVNKLRGLFGR